MMQDDRPITIETLRPAMGDVESAYTFQWNELSPEPQELSAIVSEMKRFDASHLAEVTKNIVNKFGTHELNILETAGVVSLDEGVRTEVLDPEESLKLDRADSTDLRNMLPVGEHEQYIDAITQVDATSPAADSSMVSGPENNPLSIGDARLAVKDAHLAVDGQFAFAA